MKITRTQALGEIMACIIATEGATVREIMELRQASAKMTTYKAVHKLRDAGLIRVCGRARYQSPRYCITDKGIACWLELLKWAEGRTTAYCVALVGSGRGVTR